jgi:hypothetical protein
MAGRSIASFAAECRLSRVDLSSDEQGPIIDEFIRLLKSKNIDVLDHHREGAAFVRPRSSFLVLADDRGIFRAIRGNASDARRRGIAEATS